MSLLVRGAHQVATPTGNGARLETGLARQALIAGVSRQLVGVAIEIGQVLGVRLAPPHPFAH